MLLDIDMPRINGLELLKEIKAFDGGILVIMLSGIVTQTTVFQSLRMGAEACFFKPLTDAEPLVDAISDCFRKLDRWWNTLDELVRRRNVGFCRWNRLACPIFKSPIKTSSGDRT